MSSKTLPDIRCGHCQRKLGEGHYVQLSIKCPRCGTLNRFALSFTALSNLFERHGAPPFLSESRHDPQPED